MTQAISSFATFLKIGDGGGPESFTTIAEVLDISGPGISARTADVTSHDSTNGWAEKIATILDGGQVTFSINFVPAHSTHDPTTGLQNDLQNRTLRNFQIVFPDSGSTTWAFSALVIGFPPNAPVDGALTVDVTLEISGEPTLA